jgi:hypothetical protein
VIWVRCAEGWRHRGAQRTTRVSGLLINLIPQQRESVLPHCESGLTRLFLLPPPCLLPLKPLRRKPPRCCLSPFQAGLRAQRDENCTRHELIHRQTAWWGCCGCSHRQSKAEEAQGPKRETRGKRVEQAQTTPQGSCPRRPALIKEAGAAFRVRCGAGENKSRVCVNVAWAR